HQASPGDPVASYTIGAGCGSDPCSTWQPAAPSRIASTDRIPFPVGSVHSPNYDRNSIFFTGTMSWEFWQVSQDPTTSNPILVASTGGKLNTDPLDPAATGMSPWTSVRGSNM